MMSITQDEPMGCAVACVAFVLRKNYRQARKLFANPEHAVARGYYCRETCAALRAAGKSYEYGRYTPKRKAILKKAGTIVFVQRSGKYPAGHFLVKAGKGWMNPWINLPSMTPAKAGFQKRLPGKPGWIVYPAKGQ